MAYNGIKIIDGTNESIKSDTTTHVKVHLNELNQHLWVTVPNGSKILIEPDLITTFDPTGSVTTELSLAP